MFLASSAVNNRVESGAFACAVNTVTTSCSRAPTLSPAS